MKDCHLRCHCDCLRVFDSGEIPRKLIESVFDQKGRTSAASVRYRQALANFPGKALKNPLIYQTGPKTSAKSGWSRSIWEKRCISGPSQSSRIVGSRS